MRHVITSVIVMGLLGYGVAAAQQPSSATDVLSTVEITTSVLANGEPLPAGTYQLRLSNEGPAPLPGQSASAQRWVEFVANGTVVAREVAEVLMDSDLPSEGASSRRVAEGTVVELLRGGEFLRISVKRGAERYLVHLPVAP